MREEEGGKLPIAYLVCKVNSHTWYLSFLLHMQDLGSNDTVARTLKVAIRDENCRIRDENSVILVYTLFTILKSRRELHISRLKRPLKNYNSRRPHFSSTRELLFS